MSQNQDNEPVYYCNSCLSLHILIHNNDDLCGNCGSVNFTSCVTFDKYLEIREKHSEVKS